MVVGRVAGADAKHTHFILVDLPGPVAVRAHRFTGDGQGGVVECWCSIEHVNRAVDRGFCSIVVHGDGGHGEGPFLSGDKGAIILSKAFGAIQSGPRDHDLLSRGGGRIDVTHVHCRNGDGRFHVHRRWVGEVHLRRTVEDFNLNRQVVDVQFVVDDEKVHRPKAAVGPVPLRPASWCFNDFDQTCS